MQPEAANGFFDQQSGFGGALSPAAGDRAFLGWRHAATGRRTGPPALGTGFREEVRDRRLTPSAPGMSISSPTIGYDYRAQVMMRTAKATRLWESVWVWPRRSYLGL